MQEQACRRCPLRGRRGDGSSTAAVVFRACKPFGDSELRRAYPEASGTSQLQTGKCPLISMEKPRLPSNFYCCRIYYTWRYVLDARDLKVVYRELGRTAELASA